MIFSKWLSLLQTHPLQVKVKASGSTLRKVHRVCRQHVTGQINGDFFFFFWWPLKRNMWNFIKLQNLTILRDERQVRYGIEMGLGWKSRGPGLTLLRPCDQNQWFHLSGFCFFQLWEEWRGEEEEEIDWDTSCWVRAVPPAPDTVSLDSK